MRYLSLFSGIEAATVAWAPLGWECVAVAEIEPFPCAVLAHHYPNVPNLGDVTKIDELDILMLGPIDIVVFGSPCQDLSVAGKRAGLSGERSGLFFAAIHIIEWARRHCGTRYALWENVPGAFSSNRGADFGVVVGELAGASAAVPPKGWGTEGALVGEKGMVEWATLDAQWFGVAQRRRRVFAFADFGDWAGRCPVLLEPESLRGDFAPSREAGEGVANSLTERPDRGGGNSEGQRLVAVGCERSSVAPEVAKAVKTFSGGVDREDGHTLIVAHSLRADGFDASEDGTGRGTPLVCVDTMPTMQTGSVPAAGHGARSGDTKDAYIVPMVCGFAQNQRDEVRYMQVSGALAGEPGMRQTTYVQQFMQVRRLTPRECERLQGFPDDYTLVPYRGKPAADGPRYKALGNSMCTHVMHWIGDRIALIEQFQ